MNTEEDDFYNGEDDGFGLYVACPHCGQEYDEIDYEYQICHFCKFDANKKPEQFPLQPKT